MPCPSKPTRSAERGGGNGSAGASSRNRLQPSLLHRSHTRGWSVARSIGELGHIPSQVFESHTELEAVGRLRTVSAERIREEFSKLVVAGDAAPAIFGFEAVSEAPLLERQVP